ncbi:MAG: phosphate ABC transporter permease PstA, partial [Alphaproteobacteria bacterium]|nr:phosphate ABC transporter permease PstA [Alphaproteobacteria bacterium]
MKRRVRRRYAADRRLQWFGIGAIAVAMGLLATLFASLIFTGYVAFTTTKVELPIFLDPKLIDPSKPETANYRKLTFDAFQNVFPDVTSRRERRELNKIISSGSPYLVRDYVLANPDKIGETVTIPITLSDPYDQLNKGVIPREIDALSPDRLIMFDRLRRRNVVSIEEGRGWVKVDAFLDPARIEAGNPARGNYAAIAREALGNFYTRFPSASFEEMLAPDAVDVLRAEVEKNPGLIGKTLSVKLPLSPNYEQLLKTGSAKMRNPRFASDKDFEWFDNLNQRNMLVTPFTWELFFNADSRFPELAGLAGALTGSFLALLICFLLSFPIGIATAVYLEEFAPKNRWTDLIEVNINNLAAVPSVVFGLLGLAVFLGVFGLPRSAPLVGGMVLALMTLPTLIVATRAALKAVPPSIREAAFGVGASRHQVIIHHVLPLAMPGILTGTIIGLAQALGETAPLLLIGMNAFIPSIENMGVLEPAMALPTQIFAW